MIDSKKQIIVFLFSILCINFVISQNWNTNVYLYTDSLQVVFESDDTTKISVDFTDIQQNIVSDVYLINKSDSSKNIINTSLFTFDPQKDYLNYAISLNEAKELSSVVFMESDSIKLLNFKEILFTSSYRYQLNININVIEKDKIVDLGQKTLDVWRLNPIRITKNESILNINNLSFYSNIKSLKLKEILRNTFKEYQYHGTSQPKELIILIANDSVISEGKAFQNVAIVYIDSSLLKEEVLPLQKIILNTTFNWVSPYVIFPNEEGKDLEKNWLAIATPEYLTLKYLLTHQLISEEQFFTEFEVKIEEAKSFKELSLFDMSIECYYHPEYFHAFYTKGVLALLSLEIRLFKFNEGEFAYYDLIKGNIPQLDEAESLALNDVLYELSENLVNSVGELDYHKYLGYAGLKYVEKPINKILHDEKANSSEKELWNIIKEKRDESNE